MKAHFLIFTFVALSVPAVTVAQQLSQPLVNLGLPQANSFDGYINGLYILSISLAALLAVIKIIIAGVKYAFTDVVSTKGNAKQEITSALFGLLLIMGAVVVLELINPRLTANNIRFQPIVIPASSTTNPPVQAAPTPTPTPTPSGNPTPAPAPTPSPTTTTYPTCAVITRATGGDTLNTKTCSGTDTFTARKTFQTACAQGGGTYSLGYKGDPYMAVCIPKN